MCHRPAIHLAAILALFAATGARAEAPDLDARAKEIAKSLVIVDFTVRNEAQSSEGSGQGILLNKDGVILISNSLISESWPREWITELKVRLPGKNFEAQGASFLGRTRSRIFAYLKTDKPVEAPPLDAGHILPTKLGQEVYSVAISGASSGYTTYIGKSEIRELVEVSHTVAGTAPFGLTRATSPVFDLATGGLVGITVASSGAADEDQSRLFFPESEIRAALQDVPAKPFDLRRPWLPVDTQTLTGLQEDVRALRNIQQVSGVNVGAVIPGEAAEKAGLKARDIILTVDGKPFSSSPVPEMMVIHFLRVINDKLPGDKVVLGVLRDGKPMDIPVTLAELPRGPGDMPHVLSPKLGIVTRDLVFNDAYSRHIPQDTRGVMVVLVKQGAPAAVGTTPLRGGLLITKVDDQPIENQEQFLDVVKKETEKPDLREMVFVVIQSTGETAVCRVDMTK